MSDPDRECETDTVHARFYSGMEIDAGRNLGRLDRITVDEGRMQGRPCIRNTRITVCAVIGMIAGGRSIDEIMEAFPSLEREDISQSLDYAYVLCGGFYESLDN